MNHTQIEHENIGNRCDCKPIQAVKNMLIDREYSETLIDTAIKKGKESIKENSPEKNSKNVKA